MNFGLDQQVVITGRPECRETLRRWENENTYTSYREEDINANGRILLSRTLFEDFTNEYEIDNEQLIAISTRYSNVIEPSERLYIHPCFSTKGFRKLCEVYKTPLFSCYSRLLPLNTVCYSYTANFGLLDYEWYGHTIGSERMLNDHEKTLFKGNNHTTKI